MQFDEVVKSDAALVEAIGPTPQRMLDKQIDFIDDICRSYIERAPFLAIASFDGKGRADVSPKGDAPGFVAILDEKTIAIPERPGNRRADTFRNVLQNPYVGLIFFIPGRGETLRVNGQAQIVRDRWLRERLAANGKLPELALIVTVEEAFVHCTKCMTRSRLWQPDTWNPDGLPSVVEALVKHAELKITVDELQERWKEDQRTRMYYSPVGNIGDTWCLKK